MENFATGLRLVPEPIEVRAHADPTGIISPVPKATRRDGVLASLAIVLLASTLVWHQHGRGREVDDRASAAYARGITFPAKTQSESGEFPTYRWYPGNEMAGKEAVTAVFNTLGKTLWR